MEQLNAILQISILLIVSFLIGFVTSWLYWRAKYRKMKASYQEELQKKNNVITEQKHALEEMNVSNNNLQREVEKCRQELNEHWKEHVPEELYKKIVREMGEGISVSNEDGYFLVFNPKLEEITGYTREEANKHNEQLFLNAIYPDPNLRKQVAHDIDQIPENDDHNNIKTVITTKDKQKVPVLVTSTAVSFKNKKYYLTAYRDVSAKPKVEA